MTLKAMRLGNFLVVTGSETKTARVWAKSSSIASLPAPDTDWYVATTTRLIFALSCSGFRATTSWAVEQFGLAMMFFLEKFFAASALTSGTISGTSGSIRQAEE